MYLRDIISADFIRLRVAFTDYDMNKVAVSVSDLYQALKRLKPIQRFLIACLHSI